MAGRKQVRSAATPWLGKLPAEQQREQLAELARAAIEGGTPVRRIVRGVSGVPEKELLAKRKGQRSSIKKDM